jgi:D-alanine--poly(phosphoribitol) ligase subunit 1
MSFLNKIIENFTRFKDRNAFYIGDRFFTYGELDRATRGVISLIRSIIKGNQNSIGVISNDDLNTYASILAVWLTGNVMIPLSRNNPSERNIEIIRQAGIRSIISLSPSQDYIFKIKNIAVLEPPEKQVIASDIDLRDNPEEGLVYIIFTSGSTGVPKGVPISMNNLQSFIDGYLSFGFDFLPEDRFLQIYDIAFDASIPCYLIPLLLGACVFPVPQEEIKYIYALKLMMEKDLTVVKMPASSISYLRQYYDRISLKKMRYCILGGESLSQTLVSEWAKCIPGSIIINAYGPTEITVNCMLYKWDPKSTDKQLNGVVSIGKPFGDSQAIIIDKNMKLSGPGNKGELCISGNQVARGYLNAPDQTKKMFIRLPVNGKETMFYRTGDMAIMDEEGDFLFAGRIDEQVKIDSYRVELADIERTAGEFHEAGNFAAVAIKTGYETTQIHLFVEGSADVKNALTKYLESRLPYYMLPKEIHFLNKFPRSSGGKVNKEELRRILGAWCKEISAE